MLSPQDLTSIRKIFDIELEKKIPGLVEPIITKALLPIKKDIRKIQKDLARTSDFLDREILTDRKRTKKLEEQSTLHQTF